MKKLLLLCLLCVGCSTIRKVDTAGWSANDLTIYYNSVPVAELVAIEYSIDNRKYVKEMTFRLKNMQHADKVQNLLFFIHQRHRGWEIEIDYPINNFKLNTDK